MKDEEIKGRAKGGIARAESLSPDKRHKIAKEAAIARWGAKPIQATHKGSFKHDFGTDVECYVLNDANKTAVVSQIGMGRTLGLSSRGNAFPRFLTSKAMSKTLGAELREKIENPIVFQWQDTGAGRPPVTTHGYDVTLPIDLCNAIILADNNKVLAQNQSAVATQARIIVGASAKNGIRGLVYSLAGYNPSAEEVINAFKLYVQEEAKKYEPEFPNELYMQWHRLYEIPVPVRGKPWYFKYLTEKHVYYPVAQSNGKIYDLIKALKAKDGDRQKKLFQFLNNIGARALRIQLGRILEMAESSKTKAEYEKKIRDRFGDQNELELIVLSPPNVSLQPSQL